MTRRAMADGGEHDGGDLGARRARTGRPGGGGRERLQRAGAEVVVAGRNRERLTQVSPDARAVTGSLDEVCARLATEAPTVVINTVGPFAVTAPPGAPARPPG